MAKRKPLPKGMCEISFKCKDCNDMVYAFNKLGASIPSLCPQCFMKRDKK